MALRETKGLAKHFREASGAGAKRMKPKKGAAAPSPNLPRALTPLEKKLMRQIADGADVWGYTEAVTFRAIDRDFPGLVTITKAMGAPKDGAMQQPYFGAILTNKGREAVGLGPAYGDDDEFMGQPI